MRTLTDIRPLSNYRLECFFSDSTKKIADIKPFLDKEAFKPLADPIVFASALYNGGYFVEWKNYEVDLSADTLWHISTKN
ncbi:MAG TPA: DUF2442 domain-containing protein [Hanamia sp.]|nr:DUF2442 domain-containing protein [Hanamia sp.]